MKVLFVTYHYLHGKGGGVFASRGFINAFSALSKRMTLLCPQKDGLLPNGIDPSVRVVPVRHHLPKALRILAFLFGRIHRFYGVFDEVLASDHFDTVVFDACYVSHRLIRKARRTGCKVITIHHNYQCDYVRANEVFPERLPMLFWTRIIERQAVRKSDLNLVLTPQDKELLHRHYDPGRKANIQVIGVFEYERKQHSSSKPVVEDPVFIITGNLEMRQTVLPVLEWLDKCFPVLKEEIPDATVLVAGKNPTGELTTRCKECGVELIPSPEEMQSVLDRGRYYLCPASQGGGLKLRMMDGLGNGMPVLAHIAAARGYEEFIDRPVFCYSDAVSFRHALRRMMAEPYDQHAVLQRYDQVFSFDAGLDRLRKLL